MPEPDMPANPHYPEPREPMNADRSQPTETSSDRADFSESLPDRSPPTPAVEENLVEEEDLWVTVDIPNAMSVDAIPIRETTESEVSDEMATNTTESTPQLPLNQNPESFGEQIFGKSFILHRSPESNETAVETAAVAERETPVTIIEAIHESNRELVARVADIEAALSECQQKLEATESLLNQRTQELMATQKQVSRLFYKQEVCRQIIQRQEVLVETLTQKWENSQQRQAQLERECAIAQQRYHDRSYQVRELENTCQELRSRLYRQQRQTLQFKAALERCLEMPAGLDRREILKEGSMEVAIDIPPTATEKSGASVIAHPAASTLMPTLDARPIEPWSEKLEKKPQQVKISKKSEKEISIFIDESLREGDSLEENEAARLPLSLQQADSGEPMVLPDSPKNAAESDRANPSLPSFVEAIDESQTFSDMSEDTQQTVWQEMEVPEYSEAVMGSLKNAEEEWYPEDFEEEEMDVFGKAYLQELPPEIYEERSPAAQMPIFEEELPTVAKSDRISWDLAKATWNVESLESDRSEVGEENYATGGVVFPGAVGEGVPVGAENAPIMQTDMAVAEPERSQNWPAPVVYPMRTKKRESLAAIDLPKFSTTVSALSSHEGIRQE